MPDQYTHVTRHGYGSRIMKSIKGIFIGILLFVISFGVLYWNEGRVDLSKIAETAIEISADAEDVSASGQLVSVSGTIKTDETLGDGLGAHVISVSVIGIIHGNRAERYAVAVKIIKVTLGPDLQVEIIIGDEGESGRRSNAITVFSINGITGTASVLKSPGFINRDLN